MIRIPHLTPHAAAPVARPQPQLWVILGASSAMARAFALEAGRHGAALVLAGRDAEDLEILAEDLRIRCGATVETRPFDALDFASHPAFANAFRDRPEVLNLFLAFGTMPEQAAMDQDFTLVQQALDTNTTGAMSILSRFAPVLEPRGRGRMVVVGSVAGDRGRQKNYVYGAAKAALHTYLQGLRARLFRAGVTVTTLKPGFIDTAMTWPLTLPPIVASPTSFAQAAWKAADRGREVVYIPGFWALIMLILRHVPERIFKRTNI